MKKFALYVAAVVCASSAVQAHQVWIESPAGEGVVIRFGEFGENLRETSPGLLDSFGKPTATLISARGEQSVEAVKSASGFTLPFKPTDGESVVAEDAAYKLFKFKQGDKDVTSWYRPAARYVVGFGEQAPKLSLDIVPAGKPGVFKVYFKGQPLPKTKVNIVVQSGWAKEERSDENGQVSFDLPWKGSYVLEAKHNDRTPGERPGTSGPEKYDGISYVSTLHVTQPEGAPSLPAGPVATPNK